MVYVDNNGNEWRYYCPDCELPFEQPWADHVDAYHGGMDPTEGPDTFTG